MCPWVTSLSVTPCLHHVWSDLRLPSSDPVGLTPKSDGGPGNRDSRGEIEGTCGGTPG